VGALQKDGSRAAILKEIDMVRRVALIADLKVSGPAFSMPSSGSSADTCSAAEA